MTLDNSLLIRPFVPELDDGDTFIYTELLDRSKGKGNNVNRLVKTFYHTSREEFDEQMPAIRNLCELTKTRAYTRLAPRSFEKVSKLFTQMVVETALSGNHSSQRRMYSRALGTVSPIKKLWLLDVDVLNEETEFLGNQLDDHSLLLENIPSRKGCHYIIKPFHVEGLFPSGLCAGVDLHKDNPTNLYIPDGAA